MVLDIDPEHIVILVENIVCMHVVAREHLNLINILQSGTCLNSTDPIRTDLLSIIHLFKCLTHYWNVYSNIRDIYWPQRAFCSWTFHWHSRFINCCSKLRLCIGLLVLEFDIEGWVITPSQFTWAAEQDNKSFKSSVVKITVLIMTGCDFHTVPKWQTASESPEALLEIVKHCSKCNWSMLVSVACVV